MANRPSRLENTYVIGALIFLSSPFLGLFTPAEDFESGSNFYVLALQIVVYLTAGILVIRNWRSFACGLADCKWVVTLLGLALTSALWATDPGFAIRRGVVAAATTAFGIYFGTRYRREEQLTLLFYVFGIIGVLSLAMVAVVPQYGIDPGFNGPDWRGIFETKNMLGKVMALAVTAVWCVPRLGARGAALRVLGLLGFGALVVLSGSATAAVTTLVLLILIVMYRCLRWRVSALLAVLMLSLAALVLLASVGIDYRSAFLAQLGRDQTFTGRTPLWEASLVAIGKRPLLGYGFSSFWHGDTGPSSIVADMVGWIPPHAHNGLLDLCLDLGIVGVLTFGVGFVLRFRTAIVDYRLFRDRDEIWPLAFLSFLLLYNLTESTLLRPNSLFWVLYTASIIRRAPLGGSKCLDLRRSKSVGNEVP